MEKYLVTGASGYIASWIVKFLLEEGKTVHGTVRKLADKEKTGHLLELQDRYPGHLTLFEADLLNRDSFRPAMEGCTHLLHTASPFFITKIRDAERDLVRPALEGTRNVLTLAGEFPGIRRVVVTSSVAAVHGDAADVLQTSSQCFTEEHWNTSSNASHNPYQYSKTIAEREAWKVAGSQSRWNLVTVNPGFVMGPSLSKRTDSTSVDTLRSLLNGKYRSGVPDLWFGLVDVRDVARAHILAAQKEEASGRYLCVGTVAPILEMAKILKQHYPGRPIPGKTVPVFLLYLAGPLMGFSWKFIRRNAGIPFRIDSSRSLTLGLSYTPLEQTLLDHAGQLIRDGLV